MNYVDSYQELLAHKPPNLRDKLRKHGLDGMAAGFRLRHSYKKLFQTPRIQFLYVHHVFADEKEKMDRLLNALSRDHRFISYSEAVGRILNGDIDQPYISISSDDGLKNNLRAADVLDKYGAKGCFFICPSMIGERDPGKIKEFTTSRLHFPPVEFLDWKEVEALQQGGHEIGAHTLSHINIARSCGDEIRQEIAGCFSILNSRCGATEHFAWPYGRFTDFSQQGRELVFGSGFKSCASAQRGCHVIAPGQRLDPQDLLIRRDHVVLDWPLQHILYFIASNAAKASIENNSYTALCK
jgi:peptidoglycan/xylan/chitin deacetylase (PgdA/CDA1 family)